MRDFDTVYLEPHYSVSNMQTHKAFTAGIHNMRVYNTRENWSVRSGCIHVYLVFHSIKRKEAKVKSDH